MNEDISNRTLAALLAITIVVSLGGTFFVLNNPVSISGFATNQNNDTGTVTFDLDQQVNIYLNDDQILLNGTLFTSIRTLSTDGGSAVGQNKNGADYFELVNNGSDASDINAYLDSGLVIGGIFNVSGNPNVCTDALNGSTTANCNTPLVRPLNNTQVYVSPLLDNCGTSRGNTSAVSLGNYTFAAGTVPGTEQPILCDELPATSGSNNVYIGVALDVPAGQGSFTTKTFDVYFLATND